MKIQSAFHYFRNNWPLYISFIILILSVYYALTLYRGLAEWIELLFIFTLPFSLLIGMSIPFYLIYCFIRFLNNPNKINIMAFLLVLLSGVFFFADPFHRMGSFDEEYEWYKNMREEVIRVYKNGELIKDKNSTNDYILPDEYKRISEDSVITVYDNNDGCVIIYFWYNRGWLDGGSEILVYTDRDEDSIKRNEGQAIYLLEKLDDHWYHLITKGWRS